MLKHDALVVKLSGDMASQWGTALETGEIFNICYARCCVWMQRGYPITPEEIKELENSPLWNDGADTRYGEASANLGEAQGHWLEELSQVPATKLAGVYNWYLPERLGIAVAVARVTTRLTFSPRKIFPKCAGYVFNPLQGLYHIEIRGLNDFAATIRQHMVSAATEALLPHAPTLDKSLCWADITPHARFTNTGHNSDAS